MPPSDAVPPLEWGSDVNSISRCALETPCRYDRAIIFLDAALLISLNHINIIIQLNLINDTLSNIYTQNLNTSLLP